MMASLLACDGVVEGAPDIDLGRFHHSPVDGGLRLTLDKVGLSVGSCGLSVDVSVISVVFFVFVHFFVVFLRFSSFSHIFVSFTCQRRPYTRIVSLWVSVVCL